MKTDIEKKKCMTPFGRMSYPSLFKPTAMEGQGPEKAKFQLTLLIDKSTDLSDLKKAVHAAIVEKWGADKAKWPKNLRSPIRDGDEKEDKPEYQGRYFIRASSAKRPGVVDARKQRIEEVEEDKIYAGCWGRMEVIAQGYDVQGNKGVMLVLMNVQKWKDDTPFSGRRSAEEVFDAIEVDDEAASTSDDEFGWE